MRVDRELKDRERFVELAVGSCEQPLAFRRGRDHQRAIEIITQPFIRVEDLSRPLDAAGGRERLDRVRHEGIDAGFHDAARVEKPGQWFEERDGRASSPQATRRGIPARIGS